MPFKAPEQDKCFRCGKSVYHAEMKGIGGVKYHNFCFKCGMCSKMLDTSTACHHEGNAFCKSCYGKKYGPKGYGFGGGAGALSTETGKQFGNKTSEMSNVPNVQHVGASTTEKADE